MSTLGKTQRIPAASDALPGRSAKMPVPKAHHVHGHELTAPFPSHLRLAMFGLGCFWGAERIFWQIPGVYSTAVGYAGGYTPNPTYEEVCSGMTGHNEVVQVVYDPQTVSYGSLLKVFWEAHNPTQGMRQGNDIGTQYRSGIYVYDQTQSAEALAARAAYQQALHAAGHDEISTEIINAPQFFYAEAYHQQYLAKNPRGYCGLGGTGVTCPVSAQAGKPAAAR